MGRILRWRLSEGVYHVYNRGLSSAMILPADDEKNLFCDLIRKKKNGAILHNDIIIR